MTAGFVVSRLGALVCAVCVALAVRVLAKAARGPLPAYGSRRPRRGGSMRVRPVPPVRHQVPVGAEPRRW